MGFRSLRVINDDLVMPGMGFGTHPHRDMEIITYISAARWSTRIRWAMAASSAGRGAIHGRRQGVQHSEFNPSKDEAVHLLQIWIQPDRKGVKPRYAEKSLADAPAGTLQPGHQQDGPRRFHRHPSGRRSLAGQIQRGDHATHKLAKGRHAWVHVAEGEVSLNGKTLQGGDAAAVSDEGALELSAVKPAQVLLFDLN
jgi:quercetin 2,3-dioxygenase